MSAWKTSDAVASVPLRTTRSYSAMMLAPRDQIDRDIGVIHALQAFRRAAAGPRADAAHVSCNAERHALRFLLGDGEPTAVGAFLQACLEAGQQPVEFS